MRLIGNLIWLAGLPIFRIVLGWTGFWVLTIASMYDAMLHTVFLGFVMSMIFRHAPILLPAVLGRAMPYQPGLYAHLILLHLSLARRIAGDFGAGSSTWQWGGLFNVFAVLVLLFATGRAIRSTAAQPVLARSPS